MTEEKTRDWPFYVLGSLLGIASGIVHVGVEDPLLTALFVVASTMCLGFLRPRRPWRWTLLVGIMVPIVMLTANLLNYYTTFTRVGLYGSVIIILPGIAGAFGGMFGRRVLQEISFSKK
ncbi:MAG TPA: hypothetical protein VN622_09405 [Clostridia bacterium]|nr:hypothetical protein [Clostridia bacterium]